MSEVSPPAADQDDYATILAAVMETERGRWFLAEFARRNRHAETGRVLDAIARLEMVLAPASAPPPLPLAALPVVAPAMMMPAPRPAALTTPVAPAAERPVAPEPCADSTGFAHIDALSVDARLRMFH